jgi:flagellar motor switch protein FliN/FliY
MAVSEKSAKNIDILMNVSLTITAELGTCKMLVEDILKLGTGSIVELDRLAGGPVDLLVNDRLVARGEVVAVDENFGVRITELIDKP